MRKNQRLRLFFGSMTKLLLTVCLCGAGVFSARAQTPLSGTFTVNAAQSTGGTNFESLQDAVLTLQLNGINGPVVFNVVAGSGPYNEQITIPVIQGTSATNTITFNGNGNTLSFLSTSEINRAGIKLDSVDYVTIDGFVIEILAVNASSEYGYGVQLVRDADHNIIRNCTVNSHYTGGSVQNVCGIVINATDGLYNERDASSRCDDNLITNNIIDGGYAGVVVWSYPSDDQPLEPVYDNKITNNKIYHTTSDGVYLCGAVRTLVDGNEITGAPADLGWGYSGNGIHLSEHCAKNTISNNRIHDLLFPSTYSYTPTFIGINLGYCRTPSADSANLVCNNVIYNLSMTGKIKGINIDGQNGYANFYHNTISLDDQTVMGTDTYGIYVGDNDPGINIMSNVVTVGRLASGTPFGLYSLKPLQFFQSDRNVVFATAANAKWGKYNGSSCSTVTDWQNKTGQDYHSVWQDPQYTDMPNGDLQPTAPEIDNMSLYLDVATDITGAARNTDHPDVGAYEFLTPDCTMPNDAGNAVAAGETEVCADAPIHLNLEGNSWGADRTYQWQSSTTESGTYTNVGNALAYPATDIPATSQLYYRVAVTCGASTEYSTPVLINASPKLVANVYTINAAQPTGGNNFQSFSDAVLAIRCGITGPVVFNVVAGSGPYNEQVIITDIPGTSETNTITFNGNGETLSYLATSSIERAVVKLNGVDYVTFNNLHVVAEAASSSQYGFGFHLLKDADHNTIKNCVIDISQATGSSSQFAGIVISPVDDQAASGSDASYCDYNTIDSNTINGGRYGISLYSSPYLSTLATGNQITHNTVTDMYSYGILVTGSDSTLVEGNEISRPTRTDLGLMYAIYCDRLSSHLVISKNIIHDPAKANTSFSSSAYGIYVGDFSGSAGNENLVSNNLIYDFKTKGTQYAIFGISSGYTWFYHNTISLDDSAYTSSSNTRGMYLSGTSEGMDIKNNNITIRRGGGGTFYGIYVNSSSTTFTSDNNNIYVVGASSRNRIGYWGTDYATMADWQAKGFDLNSLMIDPGYADPAAADYTPTEIPLDNKGVYVNVEDDITGAPRSTSTPDIGAYEFTTCTSFPDANLVTDSIAVCDGMTASFEINGPESATTYNWYDAATDGNLVATGTTFDVTGVTGTMEYWAEAITDQGCASTERTRLVANALLPLDTKPVVTVDSLGGNWVRFAWTGVPDATGYEVSVNGASYTAPTDEAGRKHTITGLDPEQTVSITVKALGTIECQDIISDEVTAKTLAIQFYVPNTFTPNNDGRNDVFMVYGNTIKTVRMSIFNQWGARIYDASGTQQVAWDGTWKGKQQPVGIYIYAVQVTLNDGTVINKRGSLNLVR